MESLLQWFEPSPIGEVWDFSRAHARPRHHHPEAELNVVVEGQATFRIGGATYPVRAGRIAEDGEYQLVVVAFPSMIEHELVEASADCRMWIAYAPPATPRHDALELRSCWATLVSGGASVIRAASATLDRALFLERSRRARRELFLQVAAAYRAGQPLPGPPFHRAARQALVSLAGDPSLSRRELAARAGVSEGELSRIVCRTLGVPLVTHRNRLRLGRFLHELPGSRSLLDSALNAGFGSSASLHRVFREETGCSPSAFLRGGALRLASKTKVLPVSTRLRDSPGLTACAAHLPQSKARFTSACPPECEI